MDTQASRVFKAFIRLLAPIRRGTRVVGLAFALLPGCGRGPATGGPALATEDDTRDNTSRPNIIFLLADDLRYDHLGYAGHPVVRTPAIDGLAARGTRFDSAYVTTAICSVSRASILSGQYARRHGLWGFGQGFSDSAFAKTYPMQLRDAGYAVGFIGKWGVGPTAPVAPRFDYWRGFDGQGTYHHRDADGGYLHLTRLIGRQIDTFLRQRTTGGDARPWQLSVSFKAPHVQDGAEPVPAALFPSDPAYAGLYDGADWPRPAAADTAYFRHFPDGFAVGNEARKRWGTRFSTPERYAGSLAGYSRLVHGIDVVVGNLVDSLEALGLADNTVIVFTSDHGFYLGEYGFAGKWYGSEPAIRIPLVVYDPRVRTPVARQSAYALNIDFAPTIMDLAGATVPGGVQGRSLVPLLAQKPPADWRKDFVYEHLWPREVYDAYPIPSTEGIVARDVKYMRYFVGMGPAEEPYLFRELYRRGPATDPDELGNRASEPADVPRVRKLDRALTQRLRALR